MIILSISEQKFEPYDKSFRRPLSQARRNLEYPRRSDLITWELTCIDSIYFLKKGIAVTRQKHSLSLSLYEIIINWKHTDDPNVLIQIHLGFL